MANEANLTKRERQKLRREEKLAEQRRLAARARRRRLLIFGLAGLVVLAGIGAAVAQQVAERTERREAAARAAERLEALGCTPAEPQPDLGAGHLAPQELAASPPEALYPDRPASSGRHFGAVANSGVYDQPVDERYLVHNLEHGYVVVYHASDAPESQVAELKAFAAEQLDGEFPKLVVTPWQGTLPGEANFAMVSWNTRQLCGQFDRDVALTYLNEHHGPASGAPETFAQVHASAENPVRPDGDGPFLLPPQGAPPAPPDAATPSPDGATAPQATQPPS